MYEFFIFSHLLLCRLHSYGMWYRAVWHRLTGVLGLTLRRLMSYIYGAPILDVSRSHTTT